MSPNPPPGRRGLYAEIPEQLYERVVLRKARGRTTQAAIVEAALTEYLDRLDAQEEQ